VGPVCVRLARLCPPGVSKWGEWNLVKDFTKTYVIIWKLLTYYVFLVIFGM